MSDCVNSSFNGAPFPSEAFRRASFHPTLYTWLSMEHRMKYTMQS